MLLWVDKCRKKKPQNKPPAAISVQISPESSSELLKGAAGRGRACQAQALLWAG